ncbi:hypothetical protein GCM10018773_06380 [Streptomyces candidus]|nr:hypothetical protein GCM10018773_06380 [Streptomyces candidus]
MRGGFQDADRDTGADELVGRTESGDSGPHDDDVRMVCWVRHVPLPEVGAAVVAGLLPPTALLNTRMEDAA